MKIYQAKSKLLYQFRKMRDSLFEYQRSHPVIGMLPTFLRLGIIFLSIVLILVNFTALIILFTFDNESAQLFSGGDPRQFYSELQVGLLDDYGEVLGIAHNSGNKISSTIKALAYDADIIEIDVVLVDEELHAAHWSPYRFIGDRFFRGPTLAEVWGAAAQAGAIKLDLKNASAEMVSELVQFMDARQRFGKEVMLVTEEPEILTLLAAQAPRVIRMLSVSDNDTLQELLDNDYESGIIEGVSIWHGLLDADTVRFLKEEGLIIFAWTVNEPERMNELVEYGVNGIVTDNLAILNLLGSPNPQEKKIRSHPIMQCTGSAPQARY